MKQGYVSELLNSIQIIPNFYNNIQVKDRKIRWRVLKKKGGRLQQLNLAFFFLSRPAAGDEPKSLPKNIPFLVT